jgi:hypothetical protein
MKLPKRAHTLADLLIWRRGKRNKPLVLLRYRKLIVRANVLKYRPWGSVKRLYDKIPIVLRVFEFCDLR